MLKIKLCGRIALSKMVYRKKSRAFLRQKGHILWAAEVEFLKKSDFWQIQRKSTAETVENVPFFRKKFLKRAHETHSSTFRNILQNCHTNPLQPFPLKNLSVVIFEKKKVQIV